MSVVRGAAGRRWAVVAGAAVILAALPVAVSVLPVHASAIDVTRLAAQVRASAAQPYQGYAVSSAAFALPALPQLADVADLLNGDSRLRVWYASAKQWRVDLIDIGAERDTYQADDRQVTWDYGRNQLTEITGAPPVRLPRGADLVPPDLARRLLGAADETTVSPLPARRVAGIDAAGLRITPRTQQSTIAKVDVWADPATGLPLQVEVTGRGANVPILVTRFLEVNLTAPAGSVLTPPPVRGGIGYTVTDAPDLLNSIIGPRFLPFPGQLAGLARVRSGSVDTRVGVYGTGLAQFVVLPVPRRTGFDAMSRATRGGGTPVIFASGDGVLISAPLLSILAMHSHLTGQAYLLAGLVTPQLLQQAGADLSMYTGPRR